MTGTKIHQGVMDIKLVFKATAIDELPRRDCSQRRGDFSTQPGACRHCRTGQLGGKMRNEERRIIRCKRKTVWQEGPSSQLYTDLLSIKEDRLSETCRMGVNDGVTMFTAKWRQGVVCQDGGG